MQNANFHDQQKEAQINWRKTHISTQTKGFQNGKDYSHVVPRHLWEETLWHGVQKELPNYLSKNKIQSHTGKHNLLSSWISCANLYFIVKINDDFKNLMLTFLQKFVSEKIIIINNVELEFALNGNLSPEILLGEKGGVRGSGQTSPDIAFEVEIENGCGLILTECKYTEHSFYPCSARRTTDSKNKPANPDPTRCINQVDNYKDICHQHVWGRKYWDHLTLSNYGRTVLKRCPASTAGYQLFRQHSLAEGIATKSDFKLVVSSVAYDERNQTFKNCLKSIGIPNFTKDFEKLYTGKSIFRTWTHQHWVDHVRNNSSGTLQSDWVNYLHTRYGY